MKNSIAIKFIVPAASAIILLFIISGFIIINIVVGNLETRVVNGNLVTKNNISTILDNEIASLTDQVKSSDRTLKHLTLSKGAPSLGAPVVVGTKTVSDLLFGASPTSKNYESVDKATELAGGTATIFVKSGSDYVRISTNVKKDDGSRAIGTVLDAKGKAYKSINEGQAFYGVVDILGKKYVTGYEPIKNSASQVIGIWYAGFPISGLTKLGNDIAKMRVLDNGFVAMLDNTGKLLFNSDNMQKSELERILKSNDEEWVIERDTNNSAKFEIVLAYPKSDFAATRNQLILWISLGTLLLMTLLMLTIYIIVKKLIIRPVKELEAAAVKIADGDMNLNIAYHSNDELGKLANAFVSVSNTLKSLSGDINIVIAGTANGNLNTRAEAGKYHGAYHGIVDGLNKTIDALANPLNLAATYVDQISKGIMPPYITEEYKGDFNEIKVNLNECIKAISSMITDTQMLVGAASNGDLSVRADGTKHNGDFRAIILGINQTIDNIANPLEMASENIERIANGDLPELITKEYKGDYNKIKNSLNMCITNVKEIIHGIGRITESIEEGKLDDRGHADAFHGDWSNLVKGINNIIESLLKPLNITTGYIEQIATGIIPELITDNYRGDYNKIKVNVNKLITALSEITAIAENISVGQLDNTINLRSKNDTLMIALRTMTTSINGLVNDINDVAKAAIAGKLSTRADSNKHRGDYKAIIDGFNSTLDEILAPVNEAVENMKKLAVGDWRESMNGDFQGDHAILKDSINGTIDSMNDLLSQVATTIEEVTRGAMQVSDASTALSQGATEQAASLEEITSSMSEITSQTKLNAENATTANVLTNNAKDAAEQGSKEMEELNKAMEAITASSQNISKIIKVIDEIAFQTNLLALNAAVEAARAGRHGKGFAVVAEEVRGLAARSAEAAKETADLIDSSIRAVATGQIITDRTGQVLGEIKNSAVKAADIVAEIATLSNEQAGAISQINEGLFQIDKVTQTNTASAEESASASEQLSDQASNLQDMIAKFKLKNVTINAGSGRSLSNGHRNSYALRAPEASYTSQESEYEPSSIISLDDDDFGKY